MYEADPYFVVSPPLASHSSPDYGTTVISMFGRRYPWDMSQEPVCRFQRAMLLHHHFL